MHILLFSTDDKCRLQWSTRYKVIKGLCEGLDYLHQQDKPIIHKDLKPSNILLDRNMVPKIVDFGLSKRLNGDQIQHITTHIVYTP